MIVNLYLRILLPKRRVKSMHPPLKRQYISPHAFYSSLVLF